VVETSGEEKAMEIRGAVRVQNNSGEDYENAQVRLIVGVVRLVEDIVKLARDRAEKKDEPTTALLAKQTEMPRRFFSGLRIADGFAVVEERLQEKEILKESLSEYFIYTVEGRDTIANGWAKRLPSFQSADVPIASDYKFEKERWGDAVMRYYRFTNSVASKLGKEPCPTAR
jgi:hypothetical protein